MTKRILWVSILLFVLGTLNCITRYCLADNCANDVSLVIDSAQDATRVRFLLTTQRTIMATVTFDCGSLDNMVSSHPLPYTFVVDRPCSQHEVIIFMQGDPQKSWSYGNTYHHYKFGIPSTDNTIDYVYRLPYSDNLHCRITQSYLGSFSHFAGSHSEYAIDFQMPEGTIVLAARPGRVIAYRDDSNIHGVTSAFKNCGNYIIVQHEDGTYSAYHHLKYGGILVKLGQSVSEGTPIGLSGSTGWTQGPHLHFEIYRVKSSEETESLPFRMSTPVGILNQLQKDSIY